LLAQAIAAWRLYVIMMQRERETEQARLTTQSKMAAFLDAAASGQLWTDRTTKTTSNDTQVLPAKDGVNADGQTVEGGQMVTCISLCPGCRLMSFLWQMLNTCSLPYTHVHFSGRSPASFPSVFILYLLQKRIFSDKWHRSTRVTLC